jgi:hypothetical protein
MEFTIPSNSKFIFLYRDIALKFFENTHKIMRIFFVASFKKFLIELNWGRFISDLDSVFLYTLKQEKS